MIQGSINILILTDSATHCRHEGIYTILQALRIQEGVCVYVCDRADDNNRHFFDSRVEHEGLEVFAVDEWYGYETRHAQFAEYKKIEEFHGVWYMLDQPVSPEFLGYAGGLFKGMFQMNNPHGMIQTSAKSMLLDMKKDILSLTMYLPDMALYTSVEEVEFFRAKFGDIVLKSLRSFGGNGVRRYKDGDTDLHNPIDVCHFLEEQGGKVLAMTYLHNNDQSDKRILVFDGQIIGAMNRKPQEGGWLCNIASGGSAEVSSVNIEEKALIDAIDPWLKERGIYFYGLDTLKDESGRRMLSEVNTLNPGGTGLYEKLTGEAVAPPIAQGFLRLLKDYSTKGSAGGKGAGISGISGLSGIAGTVSTDI